MNSLLTQMSPVSLTLRSISISCQTPNSYFSKSRTAVSRKPVMGKDPVFESAKQKRIYREASKHRPNPVITIIDRNFNNDIRKISLGSFFYNAKSGGSLYGP